MCVFNYYSDSQNAYRCLHHNGIIYIAHSESFNEGLFPFEHVIASLAPQRFMSSTTAQWNIPILPTSPNNAYSSIIYHINLMYRTSTCTSPNLFPNSIYHPSFLKHILIIWSFVHVMPYSSQKSSSPDLVYFSCLF